MNMTDIYTQAVAFIANFEGLSLEPYFCPAHKVTIGYGAVMQPHISYHGIAGAVIIDDCIAIFEKNGRKALQTNKILKIKYKDFITEHAAKIALTQDIQSRWRIIAQSLPLGLTDNQCVAILSFVYNLGTHAFLQSTLLRKINHNPNDTAISKEFHRFVYANGKRLSGLVKRRHAESDLYFRKDYLIA